jgi:hypothetical protein
MESLCAYTGIEKADSEFVVCIDADTQLKRTQ